MDREFLWRTPVWQADLDAFGEVRNVSLLRLLQEAATRASSAVGFDSAYYDRVGAMWIIRRTALTRTGTIRYGDELTVRTWIADFRRVRSQREYEVTVADRVVARASSDWVFVDRTHGRPRRIPAEWEATFPLPPSPAPRVPFLEAEAPSGALTLHRRVESHDLDALQHVNNSNYVSFLEQAALDAVGLHGWDLPAQIAAGGHLAAVRHDLEYLDAALYGETIAIATWTTAVDDNGIERHTLLHRGDARHPLLQSRSHYRWITDAGPTVLPTALREAFSAP
ncbi:MAG: thioesterase family protein [Candidatus Binatia bacterium]